MGEKMVCNFCGAPLQQYDTNENFALFRRLGYGTQYDGKRLRLRFCCNCMEKIINECKVFPIVEEDE